MPLRKKPRSAGLGAMYPNSYWSTRSQDSGYDDPEQEAHRIDREEDRARPEETTRIRQAEAACLREEAALAHREEEEIQRPLVQSVLDAEEEDH